MVRQNVKAPVVFVDGTCRDVGMQSYDACYAKTHSCWLIFMSREKEGETANEKLYPGQEKEKEDSRRLHKCCTVLKLVRTEKRKRKQRKTTFFSSSVCLAEKLRPLETIFLRKMSRRCRKTSHPLPPAS